TRRSSDLSLNALAGVALAGEEKGLSFILPEIQIKKSIRDKTRELIIVGSFTVYILFLSCAIFLGKIYNQQAYLRRLTQNYGRIERQMGDLMEQSKKIRFIKDYLSQRRLPMLAISQLQRMVPDNMLVNFMSISQDYAITLRGQAVDLADVFKFIANLEKSNYFYDIKTKNTRKKKVKNEEVTDFELAIKLREK
ncbi:MAG: PilN domain-containing protein, partial [Candidatus Omnitrophica bacterium]|nr:PilN domain-containing protein [Candidatus Omnitrophota bacterium]